MSKREGASNYPQKAGRPKKEGGFTSKAAGGERKNKPKEGKDPDERPPRRSDKRNFSPRDKKLEAEAQKAGRGKKSGNFADKPARDRDSWNKEDAADRRSTRPDRAGARTERGGVNEQRPYGRKKPFDKAEGKERPPYKRSRQEDGEEKRPYARESKKPYERKERSGDTRARNSEEEKKPRRVYEDTPENPISTPMTLNKYIAHSGASSRREAAEFVKQGKVRVNGELVLDPGYRVVPGDQITLSGKKLTPQRNLVYILLNKPKGYITTTEDPEERKTVMDLVANADVERLFPVGRLDRNTTGLLLLTNDGTLAHKLSHPSYNIRKVYKVTLDKNLSRADYEKIVKGLELEDGKVQVDELAYLDTRHELGIEIHSGRNRIVRRIFESLGYSVEKLDRVMYAGLTKKNLARGKWRFLTEHEVVLLKHFKG